MCAYLGVGGGELSSVRGAALWDSCLSFLRVPCCGWRETQTCAGLPCGFGALAYRRTLVWAAGNVNVRGTALWDSWLSFVCKPCCGRGQFHTYVGMPLGFGALVCTREIQTYVGLPCETRSFGLCAHRVVGGGKFKRARGYPVDWGRWLVRAPCCGRRGISNVRGAAFVASLAFVGTRALLWAAGFPNVRGVAWWVGGLWLVRVPCCGRRGISNVHGAALWDPWFRV